MSENIHNSGSGLAELTREIVSAYVMKNSVPAAELPKLIKSIHAALTTLQPSAPVATPEADVEKPTPAQIRKSVQHDGIVSFVDGKAYKTLKRHLTSHSLDPKSYRDRYGLPADYPMVAPSYAERRSALAKVIGLGRPGAMAQSASRKDRRAA
ncbi:MucR family transcriptional regulator [Methylobacterium longum]|uniref:MucR family transcriptional regulator n=1 Tax=Methylobacterium longum TaxID=767694 RepID=A0ABT8ANN4_9HYPH|nr:MucR family transcriptional regulator [Methylobacterium longum]MDN3571019.1 MucR family transcriptional regulator [Methylobacterium longum]GJE15198.1 Transcriptional regulatory protein ros [Methylobacterium longum]